MKNFIICLSLWAALPLSAQKIDCGFNFGLLVPQGEFANSLSRSVGAGGRFKFYYRPSANRPFEIGLEMGFLDFGSERRNFSKMVGNLRHDYKLQANGYLGITGLLFRVQALEQPKLSPFVEGMCGFNFFNNSITLTDEQAFNDDPDQRIVHSDRTFYYGINGGVKIRLKSNPKLGLLFSCAYQIGGQAEYGDSPQIDPNLKVIWNYKKSHTNMLTPQVGIWIIPGCEGI